MNLPGDPYRYLEDGDDPQTVAWTARQNALTRAALDDAPGRATLTRRLDALLGIGSISVPVERHGRIFCVARRGRQNQGALIVREGDVDRTLLDPAALDPSGLTALDWWYPSTHGTYVACGLSRNGDERSTLHLIDTARAATFGETIPWTRYASLAWLPDERGFFYTRYPPGEDYGQGVYLHALGANWEDDPHVFGAGRAPEETYVPTLSRDGRYLSVSAQRGWAANDLFVADLRAAEPYAFRTMAQGRDALYEAHPYGERFLIRTNDGASRFRVALADPARPELEYWEEFVAEDPDATLEDLAVARGGIALSYLQDVVSVLRFRLDDGRFVAPERIVSDGPANAALSVIGLSAREDSPDVYALVVGFVQAPTIVRARFGGSGVDLETWARVASPLVAADYRVERRWFVSRDGTRVPMFVLSAASTPSDGTAPAVLTGYGGFNVALAPAFSPSPIAWLEAGGVYAVANLRGGSEFGEAWHRAGMFANKQNVFDDFIAAAEYLGSSGLADPRRIGIVGGSNGGLLVAAAEVQRPDLFRAVVCAVPLTDMLRYHLFSIARLWMPEYGDPDDPADAEFLRAYSPYHNVRDGVAYPSTLIVTAESDSRVDPMHARKFGARLQAATAGPTPIFVFVEANAGHGVGKPRDKQVEELADRWSFFAQALGVTW
jgi:prolyl oligopeptidase